MIKILILIIIFNFKIPYWYYKIYKSENKTKEEKYKIIQEIVNQIIKKLKIFKINICVEGIENIPEHFVIISNHRGLLDPLLLISTCNVPISFILKKELEKIKPLHKIINNLNCLYLDRNDIKQSLNIIIEGINLIKEGYNFVIFPEGTRNNTDNLLEYKSGSFKLATKSKVDILPVIILNSEIAFDKKIDKNIKEKNIIIKYMKPIKYNEYKDLKITEIAEKVKKESQIEYTKLKIQNK